MNELLSEALKTGRGVELGEALGMGGLVTVVGMSIVFAVLVILMLVLMLFKVIFYKDPKKAQPAEHQTVQTVQVTAPAPQVTAQNDDTELIAVLTAAVAASLNTSTYNLRIKSYRRVDTKANAWNSAGVRENVFNKTY